MGRTENLRSKQREKLMEEIVRDMKWRMERKERAKKWKNIIIRGIKIGTVGMEKREFYSIRQRQRKQKNGDKVRKVGRI